MRIIFEIGLILRTVYLGLQSVRARCVEMNSQPSLYLPPEAVKAVEEGNVDQLRSLLEREPYLIDRRDNRIDGWTLMHFAARNGHLEIIDLLMELKCSCLDVADRSGATPMRIAVSENRIPS